MDFCMCSCKYLNSQLVIFSSELWCTVLHYYIHSYSHMHTAILVLSTLILCFSFLFSLRLFRYFCLWSLLSEFKCFILLYMLN